jgi:hypothetical protein
MYHSVIVVLLAALIAGTLAAGASPNGINGGGPALTTNGINGGGPA